MNNLQEASAAFASEQMLQRCGVGRRLAPFAQDFIDLPAIHGKQVPAGSSKRFPQQRGIRALNAPPSRSMNTTMRIPAALAPGFNASRSVLFKPSFWLTVPALLESSQHRDGAQAFPRVFAPAYTRFVAIVRHRNPYIAMPGRYCRSFYGHHRGSSLAATARSIRIWDFGLAAARAIAARIDLRRRLPILLPAVDHQLRCKEVSLQMPGVDGLPLAHGSG